MRTVTVSHNWYSFPWCLGIAVPTVFGVPSDISCWDWGRVCRAWSGLVRMKVELGHSLTDSTPQTFDKFAAELDSMFTDPNQQATAHQRLAVACQVNSSVDELIQEFELQGLLLGLGDVGLVDCFKQALNPCLQESIYHLHPMPRNMGWVETEGLHPGQPMETLPGLPSPSYPPHLPASPFMPPQHSPFHVHPTAPPPTLLCKSALPTLHIQPIDVDCHNPCCCGLSPTHFPHYFHCMKQSQASVATLALTTHSIPHIVIQVGTHTLSIHKVHFQFTSYINYPACIYFSSLWILTRLIPLSPFSLSCPFSPLWTSPTPWPKRWQ